MAMMVCACGTTRTRALPPEPPRPDLLAPCHRPPPAPDDYVKTLVANHVTAMQLLDDCALRQAELAAWAQTVAAPVIKPMWWERMTWRKK